MKSQPPEIAIKQIFLHVTKACNLNCSYCYYAARKPLPDELTTCDLGNFWINLKEMGPIKLVLTGGEPLLRDDLVPLLHRLRSIDRNHQIKRCLNTNGLLVTRSIATSLVGLVDEIRVSVDALAYRNDVLRGAGSFSAALRAIDTLYDVGFEPKVLITLTSVAEPDLEKLISLLLSRGIRRINVNEFKAIGRGAKRADLRPNSVRAQEIVSRLLDQHHSSANISISSQSHKNCGVGHYINIAANGDVYPCHVLTQPEFHCGNIRNDKLQAICRRHGLLGQLQEMDFQNIAQSAPTLRGLAHQNVCMGTVFAETRNDAPWHELLPLSDINKKAKTLPGKNHS